MAKKGQRQPEGKASQRRVKAAARAVEALELRKKGWSYPQIGKHLGISGSGAYQAVIAALDDLLQNRQEVAEHVRRLELERLDGMLYSLWPKAVGAQGDKPNVALIDRVLKVMERRARLLGLDAPTELSGPGGGPLFPAVEVRIIDPDPPKDR